MDELFGHLPSKLCSAKVAVGGCLLVDWPLQVQLPGEDTEDMKRQRWERTVNTSQVSCI